MKLKTQAKSNKKFQAPEVKAGSYFGRVVQIIDLGVQKQTDWQTGAEKDPQRKLMISVEVPKLTYEDKDHNKIPRWFYKEITFSSNEKSSMYSIFSDILGYDQNDWNNNDIDLFDALSLPVMVQIGHTNTGNPKVLNIVSAPEGVEVPEPKFGSSGFDYDFPNFGVFKSLQPWMQEKLKSALNYKGSKLEALILSDELQDDDIPF